MDGPDKLRAALRDSVRMRTKDRAWAALRGLHAHEGVHVLRDRGFLPGDRGNLDSIWGRLLHVADSLGVLGYSQAKFLHLKDRDDLRGRDPELEKVTRAEIYHDREEDCPG